MITNQMIPTAAVTRPRALVSAGTDRTADAANAAVMYGGAPLTWSPVTAPSRLTSLGSSFEAVRPDVAAGTGVVPALGTAKARHIGREQGRPPRGEPR